MSIRKVKHKNGQFKWEARFYLSGRNSKRVKKTFATKTDAEAFLDDRVLQKHAILEGSIPASAANENIFAEEVKHWIQLRRHQVTPGHLKNAERMLEKILPDYGHVPVKNFHAGLLSKIQAELLARGCKSSTVNRYTQAICAVLNSAYQQRRIAFHPAVGFRKLKEVQEGVGFWEQKEAESFLEFADRKYPKSSFKRWVYVAYLTAINTGTRAGEIWALRPSDIKHNGELILIERQFSTPINNFAPTKGKNYRSAPCNEHLRRELESLIEANKVQPHETIFQSKNRKPISHRNFVKRNFHKDLKEWGGRKIRFHDLRHTATTLMIAAGVDIKTAQEICGHQNAKTTMNYIHLLSESIRETARTFAILPRTSPA